MKFFSWSDDRYEVRHMTKPLTSFFFPVLSSFFLFFIFFFSFFFFFQYYFGIFISARRSRILLRTPEDQFEKSRKKKGRRSCLVGWLEWMEGWTDRWMDTCLCGWRLVVLFMKTVSKKNFSLAFRQKQKFLQMFALLLPFKLYLLLLLSITSSSHCIV